ncbi:MAG: Rrf2 family transcriptional regulator, partial [Methylobacteriaceae bacterium]|nr:Rrf2 family transcriptional regulator [Methylobacteriaceae bacterium]
MLTNKGKYGLKAMVHLAGLELGRPALVSDIALQNGLPK